MLYLLYHTYLAFVRALRVLGLLLRDAAALVRVRVGVRARARARVRVRVGVRVRVRARVGERCHAVDCSACGASGSSWAVACSGLGLGDWG